MTAVRPLPQPSCPPMLASDSTVLDKRRNSATFVSLLYGLIFAESASRTSRYGCSSDLDAGTRKMR